MNVNRLKNGAVLAVVLAGLLFSCALRQKRSAIGPKLPDRGAVNIHPPTGEGAKEQAPKKVNFPPPILPKKEELPQKIRIEEPFRVDLPAVPREFRGVWVATVNNINWPSKNNFSTERQQKEAIELLDFLKDHHFNAVIFQVRPAADAFYESELEPWSPFLTGRTGRRPQPYYDPLAFWIEEAHKRGLELHAWLNPYRAHHSTAGPVTSESLVRKMPTEVVRLRNGMYWFDPASPQTQDHAVKVVMDIVKRYDVDGIHFDDYFYPYASYNGGRDFPDHRTWTAYRRGGGNLSRADWRRNQVNTFVERIYRAIKAEKNSVKFGISPFGIWKPGHPVGIRGSSQYDELYADAKRWLNQGWVDYFAPQLYWPIQPESQSFTALLRWWASENTHKRHLWPGLNTVSVKSPDRPREITQQIEITRQISPNSVGALHWSLAGLTSNSAMAQALKSGPYRNRALPPPSPWLRADSLSAPTLLLAPQTGSVSAKWLHKQPEKVFQWVAYAQYDRAWEYEILTAQQTGKSFPTVKNGKKLQALAIKAVDRLGNESDYTAERIKH